MPEEDWSNERYERSTQQLRDTNAGLVREIESMGAAVDLTMARLEHFVNFLVSEGVIAQGQQTREQYQWEKGLRNQLISMRDQVKKRLDDIKRQQRKQQAALREAESGVPEPKPGLILPPSAKK